MHTVVDSCGAGFSGVHNVQSFFRIQSFSTPKFGISEKRTKRERINVQQINEWKVHKKQALGKMKNE